MAGAAKKVEAEYYIPHLAHATMEPPSATARIADGKVEVWTSVQSPQAAHDLVAKSLGVAPENVTVHVMLLGGGLAESRSRITPWRRRWSRKRSAAPRSRSSGRAKMTSATAFITPCRWSAWKPDSTRQGHAVAWRHNSVAPTIFSLFKPDQKHEAPFEMGMGLVDMPFDVRNISIENGAAEAHTKIGWFRSVSNIPHAFAIQSFAGELAAAAGKDPKEFVLDLIGPARIVDVRNATKNFWDYGENPDFYPIDTGRLRKVLELAAEKAGWGRKLPLGHGLGLAVHRSFVTYVAAVMEVGVDEKGNVSVPQVDIAVDCGPVVNPDRVRAQMEGAVIMGLSLAMKSEISFAAGKVQQGNYDDYQVLRINEAPGVTHVHIVTHGFNIRPGGVGEPGVPPIAPAFINAIFAATGNASAPCLSASNC